MIKKHWKENVSKKGMPTTRKSCIVILLILVMVGVVGVVAIEFVSRGIVLSRGGRQVGWLTWVTMVRGGHREVTRGSPVRPGDGRRPGGCWSPIVKTHSLSVKGVNTRVKLTFWRLGWCAPIPRQFLRLGTRVTRAFPPAHHGLHKRRGSRASAWVSLAAVVILASREEHVCSVGGVRVHVEQSSRGVTSIVLISSCTPFAFGHKSTPCLPPAPLLPRGIADPGL